MTVKCIKNKSFPTLLTLDKEYQVIKETSTCYIIINDKGLRSWHGKNAFEVIDDLF